MTPPTAKPTKFIVGNCPTCGHQIVNLNGRYLKYLRQAAGLDQRTLAKRMGISGPYLSDLERNRRECPDIIWREYRKLTPTPASNPIARRATLDPARGRFRAAPRKKNQ